MKTIKALRKSLERPKSSRPQADELATEYQSAKEEMRAIADKISKLSDQIKTSAEKFGKKNGAERLIYGKNWAVGFVDIPDSLEADYSLAKKALPPDVLKRVTRKQIDNQALEQLVRKGLVSKKVFLSLLRVSRQGCRRLVVTNLTAPVRSYED